MNDINVVALTGRLATAPEVRVTRTSGTPVLNFRLAVNERVRGAAEGQWDDRPSFMTVTVFGRSCDWLSRELGKGMRVSVAGRLRERTWEKDGQRHSVLEVVADRVVPQDQARDSQAEQGGQAATVTAPAQTAPADVYDEDVPF